MPAIVGLIFACMLASCQLNNVGASIDDSAQLFFRMTTSDQLMEFRSKELETQYELVIFGNQFIEPPAMYLIPAFARHGQAAIPLLAEKLANAKGDGVVRDIVAILVEMQRLGLYKKSDNSALSALVEDRVAHMTGQWKSVTESMMLELR